MSTFYADMAIDAIQNTKKQMVSSLVKADEFANPLNAFVDAQTSFAKTVAKTTWDMWDATGNAFFKAMPKGGK